MVNHLTIFQIVQEQLNILKQNNIPIHVNGNIVGGQKLVSRSGVEFDIRDTEKEMYQKLVTFFCRYNYNNPNAPLQYPTLVNRFLDYQPSTQI